MALTIVFAGASLLLSLTVVPVVASFVLKNMRTANLG